MLAGRFQACFTYAVRVCIPGKRLALLAVPTVGAVLFGLLTRALDNPTHEGAFNDVSEGLFGLVLPFACLVVGDAVLGAERRSGALALTWLSPTPFATIVLSRWLAGWLVACVALVPAMALAAVVAQVPDGAAPMAVATIAASCAYVALFVLVGAAFQRAALWSLAIVMLGERLLGDVLSGIAQLSPQWLARTTYARLGPHADDLSRSGVPSGWSAVVRLALVTAVVLVLAVRQVRRLQLAGVSDDTPMGVRLDPEDEYTHAVTEESNFNESMYFNVVDPATKLGGFFRLGNRPNEGTGEMTVCLYKPDGSVGFMFKRPEVTSNERFDAAGLRFEVVTPFEELKVSYDGKVVLLDDPLQLADPKAAFTSNPYTEAEVRLTYTRVSDMVGGEPDTPREAPGEEFAKGHYEQLVRADGTIRVGEDAWEVHGFGLRDHSWGPRYWQAPWYYRWLTANAGDDFGFMASRIAKRDAEGTRGGFVWEDGQLHLCDHAEVTTEWTPAAEGSYHSVVRGKLRSSRADREWSFTGKVATMVPLRNRRHTPDGDLLQTRISEGLTEWTMADGQVGWGLSEYLDQIIDEQPVGLAE